MTDPWIYPASLVRVIDGDTVVLTLSKDISVDFGLRFKFSTQASFTGPFRIAGIDAPEMKSKSAKEVKAAKAAKAAVEEILGRGTLTVHSHKPAGELDEDKYGRWLCSISVHCSDGTMLDLATELVNQKLAVPYTGGPRQSWTDD